MYLYCSADDFFSEFGPFTENMEFIKNEWDSALKTFPGKIPPFLTEAELLKSAEFCGLDAESVTAVKNGAAAITSNPVLLNFAWLIYWKMYIAPDAERLSHVHSKSLSVLEKGLGEQTGTFSLIIALGIVPFIKQYHSVLGVEEVYTKETMLEIRSLMDNYKRATGQIGIFDRQLYWIQYYIHGNIFFRIGRFEYWIKPYSSNLVNVYRHKKNHNVIALIATDKYFNDDGYCDSPAVQNPEKNYWRSKFEIKDDIVTGNPVSPEGRALRKRVSLSLDEWYCVMDKNSNVLDMHIPAGGKMDIEACCDSVKRASEFYRKYFPNIKPAAVNCHSWIFSPNLPEFMPENSNLVSFCKEVYQYPFESSCRDGIWFFFYQDKFDPKTAPRTSSLQKSMAEHLEAGKDLRLGGMFFLLDDIEHFGTQFYRKNFTLP